MNKITLTKQFLVLFLTISMIGQGIFVPKLWAGGSVSITVSIRTENQSPTNITDLTASTINRSDEPVISTGIIKLSWTAPVDLPDNNQVFSYIVRYATFSIESLSGYATTWWEHSSVKTLVSEGLNENWGIYSSTSPGGKENLTLSGLIPGEYYWFSGKAVDRYNNKSEIDLMSGNITTQPKAYASTSMTPPGKITTLVASAQTGVAGRINLNWLASGNDGYSGKICEGKYRIVYSTISPPGTLDDYNPQLNWPASTSIYLSTSNVLPGTAVYYPIDNLLLQTTYYLKIWVADEWFLVNKSTWNWSFESYLSSAMPYISAPPEQVTGFSVTAYASTNTSVGSYIELNWTNPVKWNYDGVKICTSTIVSATTDYPKWEEGEFIKLTGLTSGTTSTYTFNLLKPRTSYFYSIYAYDKAGLYSARTTGYAFTSVDLIGPEPPSGLTVLADATTTYGSYVKLSWLNTFDTSAYQNSDWDRIVIYVSTTSYPNSENPGLISLQRTLDKNTTTQIYINLEPQVTYYFSVFNYDSGNNGSSSTISIFIWKDVVAPGGVTFIYPDLLPSYSLDISSGCMLKLRIKLPADRDLDKLYITGREDKFPDFYTDGSPELSEVILNPVSNGIFERTRKELIGNLTYYFGVYLFDWSGNISSSAISGIVPVPTDNTAPLMPQIFEASKNQNNITLSWKKCDYEFNVAEQDYLDEISTTVPLSTNIYRYQIYESTDMNKWNLIKRVKPYENAIWTTTTTSLKYYRIRALDIAGEHTDSLIVDSSDELNLYSINQEASYIKLSKNVASALFDAEKTSGKNIYIKWSENTSQEVGPILKSLKIDTNFVDKNEKKYKTLTGFKFNQPDVELGIAYGDLSKSPSPSAQAITEPEKWLSNFYFNGREWFKLPSSVDKEKRIVKSSIKFLGSYQLRVALNATELTYYKVIPRIITPNRDRMNDAALFHFENPKRTILKIKIFDVTGALVKDLGEYKEDSTVGGKIKSWDGTDTNNDVVPPGTYIYQIEGEGKIYNGTIIVAR